MLRWMILGILLALPQRAAANSPRNPKLLKFELAVPAETAMGQVLTEAFSRITRDLGYDLRVTSYPPKRGLVELKAGRVDGSIGRSGNFNKYLGTNDFVRVDVPVVVFRISRWCRTDRDKTQPVKLGMGLGYLLMTLMMEELDTNRVKVDALHGQKSGVQMLQAGRLDCLLSNHLILETEGVTDEDLKDFERFDLLTIGAYPWISKRHEHLKSQLEARLRSYPFSAEFRKKFQDLAPACEGTMNILCPDGVLFTKRIDFR